jgi:hypothetical protein
VEVEEVRVPTHQTQTFQEAQLLVILLYQQYLEELPVVVKVKVGFIHFSHL